MRKYQTPNEKYSVKYLVCILKNIHVKKKNPCDEKQRKVELFQIKVKDRNEK